MPLVRARERRLLPGLRHVAKRALVRFDVLASRGDPFVRPWVSVLGNAKSGHVVMPSRALQSSRAQALDFAAHGLVRPGDAVLDVGAGNGRQAIGLLELGVAEYVGLDVVKASIDYSNAAFADVERVRFVHFDVANDMYNPGGSMRPGEAVFPFPDASFDFAIAGSLYTHLERIEVAERYVAETARVLRPGGHAFMSFFRSPPNELSASAVRTVLPEAAVRAAVEKYFDIESDGGGTTTGWHDQWRLYVALR